MLMSKQTHAGGKYICPYSAGCTASAPELCTTTPDGESFATLAELQVHVQSAHPGKRIPIEITWD
jgi:hypothetical protein